MKGGLCYEVIFKLQYNFALHDCTSEALHRVESPRYIVFLNQSNNYKINYKFSIFEMKSIYQIMPHDGCGVEVEHFGL